MANCMSRVEISNFMKMLVSLSKCLYFSRILHVFTKTVILDQSPLFVKISVNSSFISHLVEIVINSTKFLYFFLEFFTFQRIIFCNHLFFFTPDTIRNIIVVIYIFLLLYLIYVYRTATPTCGTMCCILLVRPVVNYYLSIFYFKLT